MFVTRTNVVYFSFAFFFNSYTPSKSHYFIDVQNKVYINGHWKHVVTQEWKNVRSTIHFIKYICFSWMLEYLHKSDQIPIIILWVFTLKCVVYRDYISYMNGMKTRVYLSIFNEIPRNLVCSRFERKLWAEKWCE